MMRGACGHGERSLKLCEHLEGGRGSFTGGASGLWITGHDRALKRLIRDSLADECQAAGCWRSHLGPCDPLVSTLFKDVGPEEHPWKRRGLDN